MNFVFFYPSLVSDWNNGNAHFLRGIARELLRRGHSVRILEPINGWSRANLLTDHGPEALAQFDEVYPELRTVYYDPDRLDLDAALDGAQVVLVHEWNPPGLIALIGRRRAGGAHFRLFFHDTHHRSATHPDEMAACDLSPYDGVLAFGEVIREIYLSRGWSSCAWTWHEAADDSLFRPVAGVKTDDLVWVGNWGDEERSAELHEFLLAPVKQLGIRARVHGVRYPPPALEALCDAGLLYGGWLPNFRVPEIFSRARFTVHVPRGPYVRRLRGIPTIRVFEALACGIPLICSPWEDAEGLFRPGIDYIVVQNGEEMKRAMRAVLEDADLASSLSASGRQSVLTRHTCRHRVEELLDICLQLGVPTAAETSKSREVA